MTPARTRAPKPPVLLRSARFVDVVSGDLVEPAELLIQDERIVDISPTSVPDDAEVIDLGDLTLLPGLMDMEVNLLLGGPKYLGRAVIDANPQATANAMHSITSVPTIVTTGSGSPGSTPVASARIDCATSVTSRKAPKPANAYQAGQRGVGSTPSGSSGSAGGGW